MEANIAIPEEPPLQISSMILANRIDRDPKSKGNNKPFVMGGIQFVPSPRQDFVRSDTLYLFFQIYGLTEDLHQQGRLTYVLSNETGSKPVREKALKDYPNALHLTEEFSLADLSPGYYSLRVTLTDPAKKESLSKEAPFMISPMTGLPRPWVLSLSQPAPDDPSYIHMRGNQYFKKKDLPRAKLLLEDAYRKNPRNIQYALGYGRALFADQDYERVIHFTLPFLQGENKYDVLEILGQSNQALDRFAEAISYYKEYLARFGTNLSILNSIGDCYYRLGNLNEALVAWEKSIEVNPKQEDLKKRVQQIKEKK
jgi:tetratricopeptide (TPR) repeat protein